MRSRKTALLRALCLLLLLCLPTAGCTRASKTHDSAGGAKRAVIDRVGTTVSVPARPARVVALAPSIVENLYFLGAGKLLVGATTFSNFPPEAAKLPTVGSYSKLDIEKIAGLAPDLIIAMKDGNEKRSVERLQELGFPVFVLDPRNVDDVIDEIELMAHLVNIDAAPRVRALRERLRAVDAEVAKKRRPRVFLQLNRRPLVTAGPGTFSDDVILRAGGDNVADSRGPLYPVFNVEKVVCLAPEVMIISSMGDGAAYGEILQEWARWPSIPAVKRARLFRIDADLFRPSPRIVDVVEQFAGWFHGKGAVKP